ncbi:hypothetical protein BH20VER3_BH20VER3_01290 [soil metagenome]
MSLREKLGMFVLTKQEQRTVAFIIIILVLGLLTKHYREQRAPTPPPQHEAEPAGL